MNRKDIDTRLFILRTMVKRSPDSFTYSEDDLMWTKKDILLLLDNIDLDKGLAVTQAWLEFYNRVYHKLRKRNEKS